MLFVSLGFITQSTAQVTSGTMKMALSDFEMPGMEGDMGGQMEEMMKSMNMTIHFSPEKQVTVIEMMGMMTMEQHYDDDVMTQYMDMMGQKIMIKTPMDAQDLVKQLGVDIGELEKMYNVSYDKSDTKEILGFKCYRADIAMDLSKMAQGQEIPEQMKNMNMTMYITEAIKMKQFNMQNMPGLVLEGTPLTMTMDMGMMKMTYEASSFDENVDPSMFEKPEGDYKEMSMEDLQKMGMGSGGFGF